MCPSPTDVRKKIALFCNVEPDCVIQNTTAETLYEVPLLMAKEGLDEVVCRKLGLITHQPDLREWSAMVKREKDAQRKVRIALVGKYTQLHDAYLSVVESLNHAGTANDAVVDIRWVDSETLTEENAAPGTLRLRRRAGARRLRRPGHRGHDLPPSATPGKTGCRTSASAWACRWRWWSLPATCWAVPTPTPPSSPRPRQHPVIDLMPDQVNVTDKGGTMRLGTLSLRAGWRAPAAGHCTAQPEISERHRHRYEFNNDYREADAVPRA